MKWLIILFLLLVLGAIVAIRYRRQIQTAIYVFRMFRKMRQMGKADKPQRKINQASEKKDIPLVRCARCQSWKPQSEAVRVGAGVFYCSANCLEKSTTA